MDSQIDAVEWNEEITAPGTHWIICTCVFIFVMWEILIVGISLGKWYLSKCRLLACASLWFRITGYSGTTQDCHPICTQPHCSNIKSASDSTHCLSTNDLSRLVDASPVDWDDLYVNRWVNSAAFSVITGGIKRSIDALDNTHVVAAGHYVSRAFLGIGPTWPGPQISGINRPFKHWKYLSKDAK